jgi:hypothetical protein
VRPVPSRGALVAGARAPALWFLLLSTLLALSTPAHAAEPVLPRDSGTLEVWMEPLLPTAHNTWVVASDGNDAYGLLLPLGVTWRPHPGALAWSAEVLPFALLDQVDGVEIYGLQLSGGPVLGAGPGEGGFFAQPLVGVTFGAAVNRFPQRSERKGLALELGAAVGYRFQWGHFSLTPLLGVRAGLGFGSIEGWGIPALRVAPHGSKAAGWDPFPLVNVDVDLLRLGWTF